MTTPLPQIDELVTDELIAKAADVIDGRRHNYDVNSATWKPYCICGWIAEEPYDVAAYDRHLAGAVLEAVLPGIIQQAKAEALREAADDINARRNGPELIAAADKWGGYYSGIRTAMENEEFALRARAAQLEVVRDA